jgi:2-dehydropantoate 2-reductase
VRWCILGAGGLGSALGGWLAAAGDDVVLVARPAHVEAIRRDGLRVTGFRGEATIGSPLSAVTDPAEIEGDVDALVLLTKTRGTDDALAAASPIRDRVAVAFSLQNAVDKDDRLAAWLGSDRVIGASTTEAATLVEPGLVRHVGTAPTAIYLGELDGRPSGRVAALATSLSGAGFATAETPVITQVEWEKLLQISAVAGCSVSIRGLHPGGSFADDLLARPAAEHYVQLATELLAVYRAMGYEPQDFYAPYSRLRRFAELSFEEAVEEQMAAAQSMLDSGVRGRPSLHVDLLRGKPTEVDDCLLPFLRAAAAHGLAVPTVQAVYRIIGALEILGAAANGAGAG